MRILKKKLSIIIAVLVISIITLIGVQKLQQKYIYTASNSGDTVEDKKEITEDENKVKEDNKEEAIAEKALETDKDKKEIKEEVQKEEVKNNNNDSTTKVSKEQENNKTEAKNESSNTNTASTSSQNVQVEKKEDPNIFIIDEVNGKQILSCYLNIEGKNAANVTIEALTSNGISYKVDSSMYFSSIAGLKERSAGKASGWCYYVNGVKPGVGAGSYVLKKGDKVTWKFLKDGINN